MKMLEKMKVYNLKYPEYEYIKDEYKELEENFFMQKLEQVTMFFETFGPESIEDSEDEEEIQELQEKMELAEKLIAKRESFESDKEWYEALENDVDEFEEYYEPMDGDASQEDLDEAKEKISDFEYQIKKVIALLDQITELDFKIEKIDCSRKTISTYFQIKASEYERFEDSFSGDADFSYYADFEDEDRIEEFKENDGFFKVRISDHEPGGFTSDYDLTFISYDDNQVQFSI